MTTLHFRTPAQEASAELVEKKSRFIGRIRPVCSEAEALALIAQARAEHPGARHTVYAYIVEENGARHTRYSDDGEPQGTAGTPVLDVLQKRELLNVAAVVTRYFGGTLLGAAGLVRAYSKSAADAAERAGIADMYLCDRLTWTVPYADAGRVQNFLTVARSGIRLLAQPPQYAQAVHFTVEVYTEDTDRLRSALRDLTGGRIQIDSAGQGYATLS